MENRKFLWACGGCSPRRDRSRLFAFRATDRNHRVRHHWDGRDVNRDDSCARRTARAARHRAPRIAANTAGRIFVYGGETKPASRSANCHQTDCQSSERSRRRAECVLGQSARSERAVAGISFRGAAKRDHGGRGRADGHRFEEGERDPCLDVEEHGGPLTGRCGDEELPALAFQTRQHLAFESAGDFPAYRAAGIKGGKTTGRAALGAASLAFLSQAGNLRGVQ